MANGKVTLRTPFRNVYVQLAAGDAGGAIGAAYTVWHATGSARGPVMDHAYWGLGTGFRWGRNPLRNPLRWARYLAHRLLEGVHCLQACRRQVHGAGCAQLLDPGTGYRLLAHYIDPAEQVRQLVQHGFEHVRIFDRGGDEIPLESKSLDGVNPVHYLAWLRRPTPNF